MGSSGAVAIFARLSVASKPRVDPKGAKTQRGKTRPDPTARAQKNTAEGGTRSGVLGDCREGPKPVPPLEQSDYSQPAAAFWAVISKVHVQVDVQVVKVSPQEAVMPVLVSVTAAVNLFVSVMVRLVVSF